MPERATIFALSSGRGPAAIAVTRISGPRAGAALEALGIKIPVPRKAGLARVRDPQSGEIIDEVLVLWFPAPHSETGEDTAELQLHGGRAVIAATLAALGRVEGLRPAEAGEFTRRAFENGKLDLTAVEGLADLVNAETEGQRRQAFRQMKGLLGDRAESWRARLIQALALVEARIDFSDEADVPEDLVAPAQVIARELTAEIEAALADGGRGERLREGLVAAIAGPPNAGKSTLLNRIARREAAIVSPYAGTTRDVIEVHLDLHGLPVTLLDTAGIRETSDPVEMEGVRRARERAAGADLVLWVVDASQPLAEHVPPSRALADTGTASPPMAPRSSIGADPGGRSAKDDSRGGGANPAVTPPGPPVWLVRNKIDLIEQTVSRSELERQNTDSSEHCLQTNKALRNMYNSQFTHKNEHALQTNDPLTNVVGKRLTTSNEQGITTSDLEFNISATSGEGFDQLLAQLARYAESFMAGAEQSLVTRERHRRALQDTLGALRRALGGELLGHEDLLAEELRVAAMSLGRLTGRVDVEDILDVIFRDFCIGK